MALERAKAVNVYFQTKVPIHSEELQPFKLKETPSIQETQ